MKIKIIEEEEQNLDDLVKRARTDKKLKELMWGKKRDENLLIYADEGIINLHGEIVIKIAERSIAVNDFAVHTGRLIDCGYYVGLHDVFDDDWIEKTSALNYALCENNGQLYVATTDSTRGVVRPHRRKGHSYYFDNYITALCSHNGGFYGGDSSGQIHNMLNDNSVVLREVPTEVSALCSHEGHLYCAYGSVVRDVHTYAESYSRPGKVKALCVHNGRLLDGGEYGIYDTINNKPINADVKVNAMISVPRKVFGKYVDEILDKKYFRHLNFDVETEQWEKQE
jgi:hypothetical protein